MIEARRDLGWVGGKGYEEREEGSTKGELIQATKNLVRSGEWRKGDKESWRRGNEAEVMMIQARGSRGGVYTDSVKGNSFFAIFFYFSPKFWIDSGLILRPARGHFWVKSMKKRRRKKL